MPNFVVFKYVGRQKTRSRSAFVILFIILSIAKIAKSLTFCKTWCKKCYKLTIIYKTKQ